MAVTYQQMVRDGLVGAGVLDENQSPSAVQAADAVTQLNRLLTDWQENREIDLGFYSQTDLTATLAVPEWAERAVELAFSVVLQERYKLPSDPKIIALAESAYESMSVKALFEDTTVDMSHLPQGQAKRGVI